MILFASDLDNTLIFSKNKMIGDSVCVEYKDGKELSYMTARAHTLLQDIAEKTLFVPVTTRSVEQYRRIRLVEKKTPHFALVSNGGTLLVDGKEDKRWYVQSREIIAEAFSQMEKAILLLKQDELVTFDIRLTDGLFVFTKTSNAEISLEKLRQKLDTSLVSLEGTGEKIYVVPKELNKGNALKRLLERTGPLFTASAGDSSFDISLLQQADFGFVPGGDLFHGLKSKGKIVDFTNNSCFFSEEVLSYVLLLHNQIIEGIK